MADTPLAQTIRDAEIDARSLSEFVYKPADFTVSRRLASSIHTLQYYLDFLDSVPSLADTAITDAVSGAISNTGFELLDSFADGATITKRNQALKNSDGKYYRWDGDLPKTVASGSTPASSGGTGTGKWLEVSDSALRTDLAKTTGAGLVGIDVNQTFATGTVGHVLSRKRVLSGEFLPTVKEPKDSGRYLLNAVSDAPFSGIADVQIYRLGPEGTYVGMCELTSFKEFPTQRKAMATLKDGVWSEFEELPTFNRYGEIKQGDDNSKIKPITRGGYSWWSEPQSIDIQGIYPKTILGAVDDRSGVVKAVTVDNSTQSNDSYFAALKNSDDYTSDEHNAPVTVQCGTELVTFYPPHNDAGITDLPYRVSTNLDTRTMGAEKKIASPGGLLSYTQAFYNPTNSTLYVCFRSGGANGSTNSWYLASSADWSAETPTWEVNEIFTDTNQLYLRAFPDKMGITLRFVLTKNARYEGTNALWYAYLLLSGSGSGDIRTINSTTVGTLTGNAVEVSTLGKLYDSSRRIRLYDVKTLDRKIVLLYNEFDDDEIGGAYKYLEYNLANWSVLRNVDIVESGASIGSNYYFGGACFSNVTAWDNSPDRPIPPVFVSREESGTWYIEEWTFADELGFEWKKVRVIDSSKTQKLWRPRVPFNAQLNNNPNQVRLTWCKGSWNSYTNFISTIWALVE